MVAHSHELLDEGDMIRAARFAKQNQTNLFGSVVSFPVIAFETGADQIFPSIGAAVNLGDNMINCHLRLLLAAILTPSAIAFDYVLTSQHNPFNRHSDIKSQTDHRRHRDNSRLRTEHQAICRLDHFRFTQIKHYDRAFYAADRDRLEVLV